MQDHLQYIDEYFEGALGAEETRQFEQRIAEDKSFAEEVAFYLSAKQVLKEEIIAEKKKWFRQLAGQDMPAIRRISSVRKIWMYGVAAAIITVIFFTLYMLFVKPDSPEQMADKYIHQELQTLGVNMGIEKDSMQNALRLYNNGQLKSALEQFEQIAAADTNNFNAKKCAGIVYLRLENYDKALAYFQDLEKYTSRYANPATLYHALTLMKRNLPGDKLKAKQLLEQVEQHDLEGKKIAEQWLDKW
jgi:tetratricopeptide (TPR) repeat protein